jgi:hypothetical protein
MSIFKSTWVKIVSIVTLLALLAIGFFWIDAASSLFRTKQTML